MAQHFLLSAAARSLSAAKIMRMSDRGVENVFLRLRWPETDGKPVCPGCGCTICYACRRSVDRPRWRCKACRHDFSITSGTLFAWHKLPLRTYLLAVAAFCNEVKGKSMLALARDLDVQYKTAFVLAHKLREAIASSTKGLRIGGEGRTAEIDGACFGGHVRPENLACDRIDRRLAANQSGKRQVVVVMREPVVEVFTSPDGQCVVTVMDQAARVWCVGSPICLSRASGVASRKVCMGVSPNAAFKVAKLGGPERPCGEPGAVLRMFRCLDVHGAEPFICSRCAISCRIVPSVLVRIIVAELLPWNCSPMQAQKRATQLDPALPTSIQSSEHRTLLRLCNRCLSIK